MKNILIIFILLSNLTFAQTDSIKSFKVALGVEAGLYVASMYGLNQLWYADYPRSNFHWYNDNDSWLQMDKFGHSLTAYHVGLVGMDIMRWNGVPEKKAIWYGGIYGSFFLTTIEILDGYSKEWGSSWGDLIANTSGTTILISQELIWKEQRIQLKYSFFPSEYAKHNPSLLGENTLQQSLKDYNGQTLWASLNVSDFLPNSNVPEWLNFAFGYGAEGMIQAKEFNNYSSLETFNRHRQYYLSLDVNLRKVKTGSVFWNRFLKLMSFIKIPAPALMHTEQNKLKFYPLYYGQ